MPKPKLIRITTIPLSLEKLLEGQLVYMNSYFEVIAISSEKERLETFAAEKGVRSFYVPMTRKITPFQDILAVYRLFRFLKNEQPSIVHTHTPKAGIVGMLAAWLAGVPNRLHTVAGLPLMEAKGLKRKVLLFVEKLTYRFATKVYPNSKGLFDFIQHEKLVAPSKLKIIGNGSSNGIDTHYFNPKCYSDDDKGRMAQEIGLVPNDFTFVFIGRMVRDKGLVELIEAFTKLYAERKEIQLLLVGPMEQELDPLPDEVIDQIRDHPKISYVGYQNDVRPYLAVSDVMVFPSYREGFPNVVLQALAMDVPAIVSDINGCNEIVSHLYNGCIVPPKDAPAVYEAMGRIVEDQVFFQKLRENARDSIMNRYEQEDIWRSLLLEYQNLLGKKT